MWHICKKKQLLKQLPQCNKLLIRIVKSNHQMYLLTLRFVNHFLSSGYIWSGYWLRLIDHLILPIKWLSEWGDCFSLQINFYQNNHIIIKKVFTYISAYVSLANILHKLTTILRSPKLWSYSYFYWVGVAVMHTQSLSITTRTNKWNTLEEQVTFLSLDQRQLPWLKVQISLSWN